MGDQQIWVFDTYEAADTARDQLLAAGYEKDDVVFTNRQEEASPVEGAFLLSQSTSSLGSEETKKSGFLESLRGNSDDYRDTYAQKIVKQPGSFLITIDGSRQAVTEQTAEMLHRCGGTNINERTPDH